MAARASSSLFVTCATRCGGAACQDTLLRVATRADQFQGDSKSTTWLYSVRQQLRASDALRSQAKRRRAAGRPDAHGSGPGPRRA